MNTDPPNNAPSNNETAMQLAWSQWSFDQLYSDGGQSLAVHTRRKQNRDSMRRSRQRQREHMQSLKDTVSQLEAQYQNLFLQEADANNTQVDEELKKLGAENLFLRASLQKQWDLQQSLQWVLDAPKARSDLSSESLQKTVMELEKEEVLKKFGFVHIMTEAANAIIVQSDIRLCQVQRTLLESNRHQPFDTTGSPSRQSIVGLRQYSIFGWTVNESLSKDNEVRYVYIKRFKGVDPYTVMKKSWQTYHSLENLQTIKSETTRLDILQELGSDAYVAGRDVRHPDSSITFRSLFIRYRIARSAYVDEWNRPMGPGYVLGSQSISPEHSVSEEEIKGEIVWADISSIFEFIQVKEDGSLIDDDTTDDEKYCEVRFTGRTDYKSAESAYRNTGDTMLLVLRWEELHIGPVVKIS